MFIEDSNFSDCDATEEDSIGGAVCCMRKLGYTFASSITLSGCSIGSNNTGEYGGGVAIIGEDCTAFLQDCGISHNNAGNAAGGVLLDYYATLDMVDCRILSNEAVNSGGGIGVYTDCTLNLERSRLEESETTGGQDCAGGGLYIEESSGGTIEGCVIRGNWHGFPCQDCKGGAVFLQESDQTFRNCLLAKNLGGVYSEDGEPDFINCTITGNLSDAGGGGITLTDCSDETNIKNCIIWGNQGGDVDVSGCTNPHVEYSVYSGADESCNPGPCNIDDDPNFVNPGMGDWRIRANSCAVDRGHPYIDYPVDLPGNPRTPSSGPNFGHDIGAYEASGRITVKEVVEPVGAGLDLNFLNSIGYNLVQTSDALETQDDNVIYTSTDGDRDQWLAVHHDGDDPGEIPNLTTQGYPALGAHSKRAVALTFDLGCVHEVLNMRVYNSYIKPISNNGKYTDPEDWGKLGIKKFDLEVSKDGVVYTPVEEDLLLKKIVAEDNGNPDEEIVFDSTYGAPQDFEFPSETEARYVRMLIDEGYELHTDGKVYFGLSEVEFFGYSRPKPDLIFGIDPVFDNVDFADERDAHAIVSANDEIGLRTESVESQHEEWNWIDEQWECADCSDVVINLILPGLYMVDDIRIWNFNVDGERTKGVSAMRIAYHTGYDGTGIPTTGWQELLPESSDPPYPRFAVDIAQDNPTYVPESIELPGSFPARVIRFHDTLNCDQDSHRGLSEVQIFGRKIIPIEDVYDETADPGHGAEKSFDGLAPSDFTTNDTSKMWISTTGSPFFVFDLGRVFRIEGLKIWNYNETDGTEDGVKDLKVTFSADTTFDSNDPSCSFSLQEASELLGEEVFFREFATSLEVYEARYVNFEPQSNFSENVNGPYGLSEIQVYGELEYTNKFFTGLTTEDYEEKGRAYYCDQFEFYVRPGSPTIKQKYIDTFVGSDINDAKLHTKWGWGTDICPFKANRLVAWWPLAFGPLQNPPWTPPDDQSGPPNDLLFRPACPPGSSEPDCDYTVWNEPDPDQTDCPPVPCPNGPCAACESVGVPCDCYGTEATEPPDCNCAGTELCERCRSVRAPYEYRPWEGDGTDPGDGNSENAGIFIEEDPIHPGEYAFVFRVQDPARDEYGEPIEPCTPNGLQLAENTDTKAIPIESLMVTRHNPSINLWYGWHIFRIKLSNIKGISNNVSVQGLPSPNDDPGFVLDIEKQFGRRYDGVGPSVYGPDFPIFNRYWRGGRLRDLSTDFFLYRIFITPEVVRAYVDDEKFMEIVGHGLGKSKNEMVIRLHLSMHGFRAGGTGNNRWQDGFSTPDYIVPSWIGPFFPKPTEIQPSRDFKVDYYAHIPLGIDPEGHRVEWNDPTRYIPETHNLFFEERP